MDKNDTMYQSMFDVEGPVRVFRIQYEINEYNDRLCFDAYAGCETIEVELDPYAGEINRISHNCLHRAFGDGYHSLINKWGFVNILVGLDSPYKSVAVNCRVVHMLKDMVLSSSFLRRHHGHVGAQDVVLVTKDAGPNCAALFPEQGNEYICYQRQLAYCQAASNGSVPEEFVPNKDD